MCKEIKISGCNDCPFCNMNDMASGFNCQIEKRYDIEESEQLQPITPSWCPIKKEDVLITQIRS